VAISIYELCVPAYLQTIGGLLGVLDKGREHAQANGTDPDSLLAARIHDDMLPLSFQLVSVVHHSLGALRGVQAGEFTPPPPVPDTDYAGFRQMLVDAQDALQAVTPQELNDLGDSTVVFRLRSGEMQFSGLGFLQSFSLPNFYFHATTAYDILRASGVGLSKLDFLGGLRLLDQSAS
jgi:hypothetical protein